MRTFLVAIMLIPSFLHAQKLKDLEKYSYICFSVNKDNSLNTGTCYFYKYKSEIYAITNYHVVSGFDPITGRKVRDAMDTMYVAITPINGHKFMMFNFPTNVTKAVQFRYFDRCDVIRIGMKPVNFIKLNFINNLIDVSYFNKKPDSVFMYGYPGVDIRINKRGELDYKQSLTKGVYSNTFSDFPRAYLFPNEFDSVTQRQILAKMKATEFEYSSRSSKGASGAPVFGKFISNGRVVYKYIGMTWGTNTYFDFSVAYTAKYVYDRILPH